MSGASQGSTARIGAVAFIHRFGSLLNPHVHFHCVVVDEVFESGTGGQLPVRFHEMPALDAQQLADIQRNIRRRSHRGRRQARARTPHRHRYYGVLAPNAPLRTVVTALAVEKVEATPPSAITKAVLATEPGATDEPAHRKAARYVWALLLARIYEVLPLVCPKCGGDLRIIAFINESPVIREILGHLGELISAPHLASVRGPPLWALPATEQAERETDPQAQPAPDYEFDQRVAW